MKVLQKAGLLVIGATLAATAATSGAMANAAPVYHPNKVDCGKAYFKVTKHKVQFQQVAEIVEYNRSNRSSKISQVVGSKHKTKVKFGATVQAGGQASFFKFASASASVKLHAEITKTKTMSSTFRATGTAAPHSKIVLRYGFSRYDQYIERVVPYNRTVNTCGNHIPDKGWVNAPYANTFIVSN